MPNAFLSVFIKEIFCVSNISEHCFDIPCKTLFVLIDVNMLSVEKSNIIFEVKNVEVQNLHNLSKLSDFNDINP